MPRPLPTQLRDKIQRVTLVHSSTDQRASDLITYLLRSFHRTLSDSELSYGGPYYRQSLFMTHWRNGFNNAFGKELDIVS